MTGWIDGCIGAIGRVAVSIYIKIATVTQTTDGDDDDVAFDNDNDGDNVGVLPYDDILFNDNKKNMKLYPSTELR